MREPSLGRYDASVVRKSRRRENASSPESPQWRRAHLSLLLECGIPSEIAKSDRRWIYVLLHGDDELQSGLNTSWMSPPMAATLLGRLQADLPSEIGFELVACLRRRAGSKEA